MITLTLTAAMLDLVKVRCDIPNCQDDHSIVVVDPQCHPAHPMFAAYDKLTHTLALSCSYCGQVVCQILVDPGHSSLLGKN